MPFFHKIFLSVSFVLLFLGAGASAGVNLKNGNFFVSYTDIATDAGAETFYLTRTYNSKSSQSLSFGYGWGSNLDTRLIVNGDGSLIVQEIGTGKRYRYVASAQTEGQFDDLLDTMVESMEAGGWLGSNALARDARARLATDAELRRSVYRALLRRGLIDPVDIAVGTRFVATSGEQAGVEIFLEPGGYYRRGSKGFERFNHDGQLMETALEGEAYFRLTRDAQGHLREIILEDDTRIRISTDSNGRILGMDGGSWTTEYSYSNGNRLSQSKDTAGNVYRFEYDHNVNMTAVRYTDGSSLRLTYDPETQFLTRQKSRQGEVTTYEYGTYEITEENIVDHYYTRVRKFRPGGGSEPYEDHLRAYRIGVDSTGNRYDAGILDRLNGVETETRYHPCGSPTLQRRGGTKNVYEYDANCRMILKVTPFEEVRLSYDPRHGKITSVFTKDLSTNDIEEVQFSYDIRGNLTQAVSGDGRSADLVYDDAGLISAITTEAQETLTFLYNDRGKPVRITVEGEGWIDVTYDSSGEIDSVESDQGHQMALRVTQTFQSLLALVRPAGVNFDL